MAETYSSGQSETDPENYATFFLREIYLNEVHNLGFLYSDQGKLAEAKKMHAQKLEDKNQPVGQGQRDLESVWEGVCCYASFKLPISRLHLFI